jgi:outer membrane scaffolding protein for murein synthesis (MipA/OmpV family)
MKYTCLILMAAIAGPALGQSDTTFMPEGSKDIYLSATAALVQRAEGSSKMRLVLLPSASVLWSNGVFLAPGALGMQLSADGNLQYGPLLSYGVKNQRSDDTDKSTRLDLQAGAFVNYQLLYNLGLHSRLLYGGSDDNRGVQLNAGTTFSTPIAQHQSVSLSLGANFADQAYMQSYFGVTAQQARLGRRPVYQAGGGLKNVYLSAGWNVELTHKYSVNSGVYLNWLGNTPAASPLTDTRRGASFYTTLSYHY